MPRGAAGDVFSKGRDFAAWLAAAAASKARSEKELGGTGAAWSAVHFPGRLVHRRDRGDRGPPWDALPMPTVADFVRGKFPRSRGTALEKSC
jgi:hypothetical protein